MKISIILSSIIIILRLALLTDSSTYQEDLKCSQIESCPAEEDHESTSKIREEASCYCEKSCVLYGDCCLTAKYRTIPADSWIGRLTCRKVIFRNKSVFLQLVSRCPPDTFSANLRSKCEHAVSPRKDPFLSVPIHSQKTKINYKNIFCAVCNHDVDYAAPWVAFPLCPPNASRTDCPIFFEPPENASYRICQPSAVYSCPEDWFEPHVKKKCDLYSAPLKDSSKDIIVKNEYCAICNNLSQEHMKCLRKSYVDADHPDAFDVSFSVIIDIDFTTGGTIVGKVERCPRNHIYDPWKKLCRLITCEPGSYFRDHECVTAGLHVNGSRKVACPKLVYDEDEYLIMEDGRLLLILMNKTYGEGEFWLDEETKKVSVCAPSSYSEFAFRFSYLQYVLTSVGLTVSISSLAAKIVAFFVKPEPRKTSNILVLFLSGALLVAQALFLLGTNNGKNTELCKMIGISMHYFFLSSFFWMNALSYDIYQTFGSLLRKRATKTVLREISTYSLYGWLTPAIIVATAVVFEITKSPISPQYGEALCWISNKHALLAFFAVPLAFLLAINIGLFAITSTRIHRISSESKLARENIKEKDKWRFTLYIKLALIMGITWISGFIAAYAHSCILWSIFVILNSLQGFYIFIAFTHVKYGQFVKLLRNISTRSATTSITSASTRF